MPTLLALLAQEHEVFQGHVLDRVKDLVAEPEGHQRTMASLYAALPPGEIDRFLAALPEATGGHEESARVRELSALTQNLPPGPTSPSDVAAIIAAELIHRAAWEDVMRRYPDTLQVLKDRLL
ncbi:MAG: hypothetical protein SFV51_08505 [Bryobacteraceae bacterium]|nr:hypothetical protein [Bryobacteraceae bacterium]